MAQPKIEIPQQLITDFCRRHHIRQMSLFGSVLRDDFGAGSDIDVLVSFAPDARRSLFDLVAMQNELGVILGREVDLVERSAIEQSENYIRRKNILQNQEVIYAAG
jgi:hypothetical protein